MGQSKEQSKLVFESRDEDTNAVEVEVFVVKENNQIKYFVSNDQVEAEARIAFDAFFKGNFAAVILLSLIKAYGFKSFEE